MTTARIGKAPARPYDQWRISVQLWGSAFDQMSGNLGHIDRVASDGNLLRLRTNALIGTFSGAAVDVVSRDGSGPATITISPPHEDVPTFPWDASANADMQGRVRQILHAVYQRMDWFVED